MLIRRGSISTYVLIAQDDLNTLGYRTGGLDRNIWFSNRASGKKLSKIKRSSGGWNSRMQHMALTSRRCSWNRKNFYNDRLNNDYMDSPSFVIETKGGLSGIVEMKQKYYKAGNSFVKKIQICHFDKHII